MGDNEAFEGLAAADEAEVFELLDELRGESDRGCALLAASYLHVQLGAALRARLADNEEVADLLFGRSRPIESVSAQIDLAYMLGLFGAQVRRDLHLIRQIRNDLAHGARRLTVAEQSIANRCRETRHTVLPRDAPPRRLFINTLLGVAAIIHVTRRQCEQIAALRDVIPDARTQDALRDMVERMAAAALDDDAAEG